MRKGVFVGVIITLILSLSFNVFWLLSDYNDDYNRQTCADFIERVFHTDRINETRTTVSDFDYKINENDEVRVYLYEYTKDGVNHVFSSKKQIDNVSEGLTDDIERLLTKINGKNATQGHLYGPISTVRIEINSSEYEMEIRLGDEFLTIDLTEDGIRQVFTVRNELDTEIEELIKTIKSDY